MDAVAKMFNAVQLLAGVEPPSQGIQIAAKLSGVSGITGLRGGRITSKARAHSPHAY